METSSTRKDQILESSDINTDPTIDNVSYSTLTESLDLEPLQTHLLSERIKALNDTKVIYNKNKHITEYIDEQAIINPFKTAIYYKQKELSYNELYIKSNQVANLLLEKGVKKGDIVSVVVDRSVEMIIVLLGILKAGAAYLPLDPQYPKSRIDFMMADSSSTIIICNQKYITDLPNQLLSIILEDYWPNLGIYSDQIPEISHEADDLAYILYTSGSTGNPKGVMIEHSNLANYLLSFQREPGLIREDKLLAITTICFDIAITEMFLPLITGASVVLVDSFTARDGRELLDIIKEKKVTVMQATPTTWHMILSVGWEDPLPLKIMCGGEPLSKDLAGKLLKRVNELWNVYGPTETTVWSTIKKIESQNEPITIGQPIANTKIYILDENKKPVQTGLSGEIFIGGDGVARGYLNRPELTLEKFTKNPFEENENSLIYATGDLGAINETGEIVCLGRIDSQVKIRGHRIELGEIEYHLVQLDGIKEAVVMPQGDNPENIILVAYIKLDADHNFDALLNRNSFINNAHDQIKNWRNELNKHLPIYMSPSSFYILDYFPTTNNGKTDRKSLPKPDVLNQTSSNSKDNNEFIAPRSTTEKIIAKIWTRHLAIKQISMDSNFFESGGNSLVAIKVMTDLMKETEIKLPISALFEHYTIEKLAKLITGDKKKIKWNSLVPIKASGSKPPIYLIHGLGLNVLIFEPLRTYMDSEQPIYALQGSGLNGDMEDFPKSIEELARNYISEILDGNTNGPIALAGFSFGGLLAFEMAKQLLAMGKKISMLAIIDTNLYQKNLKSKNALKEPILKAYYSCKSYIYNPKKTLKHHFETLKTNLYKKNKYIELIGYQKRLKEVYLKMFYDYQLSPLDIQVYLLKCRERVYFSNDKYFGWSAYASKGIITQEIPGDHSTCFKEPNVKELAFTLQTYLDHIPDNHR